MIPGTTGSDRSSGFHAEQWIKEGKYALNWTRLSCLQDSAKLELRVRLVTVRIATRTEPPQQRLGGLDSRHRHALVCQRSGPPRP